MNIDKNEFRKYAVMHHRIASTRVDGFIGRVEKSFGIQAQTPYIIEERELRIAQMDVFSRLMMDRIIFLGSAIDDNVANIIQAQLLFLHSTDSKKDVQMYINSPGGSVYAGYGIYDTMQFISNDVATICTGMAASMAANLLCSGVKGKRAALPHSRIMIHQPSGGVQGMQSDIEITYHQITKIKRELSEIIAQNTGQSYETVVKAGDRDHWMTAAEALEFGMVDEVLKK